MIMQSYDFYYLYKNYGCNMQFGGDDQWSNMLGGTELIRKKLGKDAHAMTITLLTDSQGNKMGKTAGNAVWLDANKTSPYDFYQYWRNVADSDVLKCIRMLTFLPLEEIDKMDSWEGSELNKAKEILAYELTALVHGKEEAEKAQSAAKSVFGAGGNSENMPSTTLSAEDFTDEGINIIDALIKAELVTSRGEARRLIEQGGVSVDNEKVTAVSYIIPVSDFEKGYVIRKVGANAELSAVSYADGSVTNLSDRYRAVRSGYRDEIEYFANQLASDEPFDHCPPEETKKVVSVMRAQEKSADGMGIPVKIEK
jgi:tyrosyl-tRNA synthetase